MENNLVRFVACATQRTLDVACLTYAACGMAAGTSTGRVGAAGDRVTDPVLVAVSLWNNHRQEWGLQYVCRHERGLSRRVRMQDEGPCCVRGQRSLPGRSLVLLGMCGLWDNHSCGQG